MPAGHVPSVEEARDRLQFRRDHGDSAVAFSIAQPFPAPDEPGSDPVEPKVSFDNRLFLSAANTPNGDCDAETRFRYRQHGARVWATYAGGRVQFGSLVAIADQQGRLRTGKGRATPELLPDGRLRLHEEWQWTNGDLSEGRSVVEEVTA